MSFSYVDPYYAGKLDGVLKEFETPLYLYRVIGRIVGPGGIVTELKKKYLIYGSLQTWRQSTNYSEDGPNTSSRAGKLLVDYRYKLKRGDIVQKQNNFYRILEMNDYDYAEVHDFSVERIGLDEIENYEFDKYLEEEFPVIEEREII